MMKRNIFVIIMGLLITLSSCQKPEDLIPSVSRKGINSIKATFEDKTGEFFGYISGEDSSRIIIEIPYFFPETSNNQVTADQLKNMRVSANIDDNVIIEPALLYMDLTQENIITVTDQIKQKKQYVVTGEIKKSDKAEISGFSLPSLQLEGVVNEATRTISLVSTETLEPALAEVTISAHATISPDPRTTKLDYNQDVVLTVTAHDGETSNVYTVKKEVPGKLPYGIRAGSAKQLFAKKLNADLGITVEHLTGGIAATGKYVVLNTRNENSIYIDAKTGEKVGTIDLGAAKGPLTNFYNTADDNGNILICNLAPNAGSFKMWKVTSVTSTPELMIEWDGGVAIGRKFSVQGSIDEDAIITAPILAAGQQIARWTVTNGILSSQTPEIIPMTGLPKGWSTNADVVYTSGTDTHSDYFVTSYSDNQFTWVNGKTNAVKHLLDQISTNYIPNAVDCIKFNNAQYTTLNWLNSFSWGSADAVWLLDVTSDAGFNGNLETKTCPAVIWECERNVYGGKSLSPSVINANGTGDVALTVSEDGYYMYLYFMFTNGYVVGYQFDCLDI
uniref:DUF5018 domain-containing protein n=1 Tax=uncultured Draconibacterium sp. TaxID=1573823 RepID=UPI003217AC93